MHSDDILRMFRLWEETNRLLTIIAENFEKMSQPVIMADQIEGEILPGYAVKLKNNLTFKV